MRVYPYVAPTGRSRKSAVGREGVHEAERVFRRNKQGLALSSACAHSEEQRAPQKLYSTHRLPPGASAHAPTARRTCARACTAPRRAKPQAHHKRALHPSEDAGRCTSA
jgi:hypothetical protein